MDTHPKIRSLDLQLTISELYGQFSQYSDAALEMCSACYTSDEVRYLQCTAIDEIETRIAQKLLWEAKDHWESADIYKRFIPRILEVMAPPELEEDLFPTHLFEVLEEMRFRSWEFGERKAVIAFLNAVTSFVYQRDSEDLVQWEEALRNLNRKERQKPNLNVISL